MLTGVTTMFRPSSDAGWLPCRLLRPATVTGCWWVECPDATAESTGIWLARPDQLKVTIR